MKTEKDLNAEILVMLSKIKAEYPELSKYLDEMPVTIPDEKNPSISLDKLNTYYESLKTIYLEFKQEHPIESTKKPVN